MTPTHHTPDDGVIIGSSGARRQLVVYEDPQCPYCRKFEEACGDLLRREVSAGAVAIEWRMRCFLGQESVRACNALALAAERNRFDDLRRVLFENQPAEQTGGYSPDDLVKYGEIAGLVDAGYVDGVREGVYDDWVLAADERMQVIDEQGTPYALLDGKPVDPALLYDREGLGALIRA